MDVREKLVEIVKRAAYHCLPSNTQDFHINLFVTDLLAHGVTVRDVPDNDVGEWIPVKDRLPEEFTNVLVCDVREGYVSKWEYKRNGIWDNDGFSFYNSDITHWMPLPDPPKGE